MTPQEQCVQLVPESWILNTTLLQRWELTEERADSSVALKKKVGLKSKDVFKNEKTNPKNIGGSFKGFPSAKFDAQNKWQKWIILHWIKP